EVCSRELAALARLRAALTLEAMDPPETAWAAFWPQVRAQIAAPTPATGAVSPPWGRNRMQPRVWAPALAAVALAVVAVIAPWQQSPQHRPPGSGVAGVQPAALEEVVIQSIETADPDLPVMVYASPESDLTVLWVFGLEPTGV